jgi:hypothetical protein
MAVDPDGDSFRFSAATTLTVEAEWDRRKW